MPSDVSNPDPLQPAVDLKKTAVLVVEDEEVIRDVICALLQKIGVRRVVAVGNAEDAIFQLEDDDDTRIDIVLVDLMLPGASGLALIKTLREHKSRRLQNLPVVVITSYTSMKVYRKAAEFDINGFLRKPISPGSLEVAVTKALGGKVSDKALANFRSANAPGSDRDGSKKKPGLLASLFGTGAQGTPSAQASATKAAPRPPPKINRSV